MKYTDIVPAVFLSRPNRFIAVCLLNGEEVMVHVKNTGRCRELLVPGATVYLDKAIHEKRKTGYSLIAVEKGTMMVNIDSQAPNRIWHEAVVQNKVKLPELTEPMNLRQEVKHGVSRFDFAYFDSLGRNVFIEVKGVTLEENGVALFPDAPTERGVRHLRELEVLCRQGPPGFIVFIIQMEHIHQFSPNDRMHLQFGEALRDAVRAGVYVLAFSCRVTARTVCLHQPVPICL